MIYLRRCALMLFAFYLSGPLAAEIYLDMPADTDIEQSAKEFKKEMEDNKPFQHEKRGEQLLREKKFAAAIVEFDSVIKLDPSGQTAYVKKGIALYNLGRAVEAIESIDQGIARNIRGKGWEWWPLYHKGMAAGIAGRLDDALAAFDESIGLNPGAQNHYGRAMVYAGLRNYRAAHNDIVAASTLQPSNQSLKQLELQLTGMIQYQNFHEKMARKPGAQVTASGLIYFALEQGIGPQPAAADSVKVHYHGTLIDGTVFDSSIDRGKALSFPLNRVIPCWTEGLQKMKVGGKSRLVCPAQIAYGDRGAGDKIKPGATLVFEVELLGIE